VKQSQRITRDLVKKDNRAYFATVMSQTKFDTYLKQKLQRMPTVLSNRQDRKRNNVLSTVERPPALTFDSVAAQK
jgi:hypothetical protein